MSSFLIHSFRVPAYFLCHSHFLLLHKSFFETPHFYYIKKYGRTHWIFCFPMWICIFVKLMLVRARESIKCLTLVPNKTLWSSLRDLHCWRFYHYFNTSRYPSRNSVFFITVERKKYTGINRNNERIATTNINKCFHLRIEMSTLHCTAWEAKASEGQRG